MSDSHAPKESRYSREDEWVRAEGTDFVIGITDYAQTQLGDVVFVELPEVGATFAAGDPFGVIESVKAVSDLFAPIGGTIAAVNPDLDDAPETVNADCYGAGWIIKMTPTDSDPLAALMDADAYLAYVATRD